jgi:hypothetical protein
MEVAFRKVGHQEGHFISNGDGAQVFYGPFAGEKEANDFIEKLDGGNKKKS